MQFDEAISVNSIISSVVHNYKGLTSIIVLFIDFLFELSIYLKKINAMKKKVVIESKTGKPSY